MRRRKAIQIVRRAEEKEGSRAGNRLVKFHKLQIPLDDHIINCLWEGAGHCPRGG